MELGFIAILESAACDAVKFSGATRDKFKSETKIPMSCYPAHPWLQKVNFKRETARRSSKFKIVLRLPARQCGKFMGAAIVDTTVAAGCD